MSIAVPCIDEALDFFRRNFPIEMRCQKFPGYTPDFSWCDFYLGDFKIELIEPAGEASFVERFLHRRGPGLHHWSLDGVGLEPLLAQMEADGLRIVDRFRGPNGEFTAFVSPRSAFGVLIQFWEVPHLRPAERPAVVPYRLPNGVTVRLRVDHLSLAVRDIEKTLAFFERYFPFRLRRAPHLGWDRTFLVASFYLKGYKVELIQNARGKSGFVQDFIDRRGEGMHHISIDVDHLDAYAAHLEANGVRVVERQTLPNGIRTAFLSPRSAFGTLIQLWQPLDFDTRP